MRNPLNPYDISSMSNYQQNQPQGYIPNPIVVEQTERGDRQYDLYSRLLKDRIVFLGTQVTDVSANIIVAQMLFLQKEDPEAPIHFYIHSPGGSVYAGLGIYDVMQVVSCPVYTYCMGMAASMGSLLLQAGESGHRSAMPHSRIMIHQPLGGAQGQCSDIQIQAKEIQELKNHLYQIYHNHTGLSLETIEKACDRDNFLNPKKAIEMGLIDNVIEYKKTPTPPKRKE